jgi:hypothetical protein
MSKELVKGAPYFLVGFYDRKFALPKIGTYIYVGRETELFEEKGAYLDEAPGERYCFQDPESFAEVGSFSEDIASKFESVEIIRFDEKTLASLMDLPGLINWLQERAT